MISLSFMLSLSACLLWTGAEAQEISPTVIAGQAGENVTFTCTSFYPGEAVNNQLMIYIPEVGAYVTFREERLWRSDSGSVTTYTFGPLMSSDNGTILRCTSSVFNSADATISITFRPNITRDPASPQDNPIVLRESESVVVSLIINANPQPTTFIWRRNGQIVTSGDGLILDGTSFTVEAASMELSGTYTLEAVNSVGSGFFEIVLVIQHVVVPPPQVQALCSVVVWYNPEVSCEDIIGYDVRFYHPQLLTKNVTRRVGANGTFHIVQEEDKLDAKQEDLYVQVRVIHRIAGEWSEGISLGCDGPTSPPETPSVYFLLNGIMYTNNSAVPLSEVREDKNALLCKTEKEDCCGTPPNRFGEFYYPNGIKIPIAKQQQGFYRNRGDKVVRLNRRDGTTSPTGKYRCEIPDASGSMQNIYIILS